MAKDTNATPEVDGAGQMELGLVDDNSETNGSNPFGSPESPSFEFDMTGVDMSNTIPEGAYEAVLIDISKDVSKNGNKMWTWTFAIINGQYSGKEFKSWTALTPSALWKLAETLLAFDFKPDRMVKFDKENVVGRKVVINVINETYQGTDRTSIKKITRHPDGPVKMSYGNNSVPR